MKAVLSDDPVTAAKEFVASVHRAGRSGPWVSQFVRELDRIAERDQLARVLEVWALSAAAMADLLGVSRQAVSKWLAFQVPSDRHATVSELAVITDLLLRYVKRERIPAIVRRPAEDLGGASIMDLVKDGRSAQAVVYVRDLLDLRRVAS